MMIRDNGVKREHVVCTNPACGWESKYYPRQKALTTECPVCFLRSLKAR